MARSDDVCIARASRKAHPRPARSDQECKTAPVVDGSTGPADAHAPGLPNTALIPRPWYSWRAQTCTALVVLVSINFLRSGLLTSSRTSAPATTSGSRFQTTTAENMILAAQDVDRDAVRYERNKMKECNHEEQSVRGRYAQMRQWNDTLTKTTRQSVLHHRRTPTALALSRLSADYRHWLCSQEPPCPWGADRAEDVLGTNQLPTEPFTL